VIGEEITVTVMEVAGQTVRLGIAAPKELPVYREEIWLAVQAENIAAAESGVDALTPPPQPASGQG
jgi:carbon storage regulator